MLLQRPAEPEARGVVPGPGRQRRNEVWRPLPAVVPDPVPHRALGQCLDILIPALRLVALQGPDEVDVGGALPGVYLQASAVVPHGRSGEERAVLLRGHAPRRAAVERGEPRRRRAAKLCPVAHLVEEHALVVVAVRVFGEAADVDGGPHAGLVLAACKLELLREPVGFLLEVRRLQAAGEAAQHLAGLVQERLLVHAPVLVEAPHAVEVGRGREGQLPALQQHFPDPVVVLAAHRVARQPQGKRQGLLPGRGRLVVRVLDPVEPRVVHAPSPPATAATTADPAACARARGRGLRRGCGRRWCGGRAGRSAGDRRYGVWRRRLLWRGPRSSPGLRQWGHWRWSGCDCGPGPPHARKPLLQEALGYLSLLGRKRHSTFGRAPWGLCQQQPLASLRPRGNVDPAAPRQRIPPVALRHEGSPWREVQALVDGPAADHAHARCPVAGRPLRVRKALQGLGVQLGRQLRTLLRLGRPGDGHAGRAQRPMPAQQRPQRLALPVGRGPVPREAERPEPSGVHLDVLGGDKVAPVEPVAQAPPNNGLRTVGVPDLRHCLSSCWS
mmetsp:Transcript_71371/g.220372  ORF Transcript_71371/g.220372 Transcript_71371/m.220372 type:complete len:556 (+) Transcript_71371:725-2392(+)